MKATSAPIDAVTLEMYWRRLVSVVSELGSTLRRTSFSTVVRDTGDYACAIFDKKARLLAQTPDSTPGLCGPLRGMLGHFLETHPPELLGEGDLIIGNDPWAGSGHHNDVSIMMPVIHNNELVGYVMTCCHQVDIGGRRATNESRDNYEEGLRIPVLKLYHRGVLNRDVMAFIVSNVRSSETVQGDLGAQVAACHVGGDRIRSLCGELGNSGFLALADEIISRSEEITRQEIRKLPNGSHAHEARIDIVGGKTLTIRTTVTILDEDIVVDYTGSSPQVAPAINCTLSYTSAYTFFAVLCMLNLPISINEGMLGRIRVVAEEGSVLNCKFPAPVFGRTAIGNFLPDFVYQAIAQAAPTRVCSGTGATPLWGQYMFGKRADGADFAPFNVSSGGMGARATRDGISCLAFPYNVGNTPVEVIESELPALVEERTLWVDSAGPGMFRGGFGQRHVIRLLEGELGPAGEVLASFRGGRFRYPPEGLLDGGDAPVALLTINGEPCDAGNQVVLRAGDRVVSQIPGGGGYGDAKRRDPDAIARDLRNGLITAEHARSCYDHTVS